MTIINRLLAGAVAGLLATGATIAPAAAVTSSFAELQGLLEAEHAAGMPGLVAEVRVGSAVWGGAAGVADLRTGRPARPGLEHRIGSVTKTFVATTVLQLVAERRVGLDVPVADYLPGVLPADLGARTTVRMLLGHYSGIGDYPDGIFRTEADFEANRHRTFRPAELAAIGLAQPRTGEPGAAYHYSNTDYILAGMLVEKVTGHTVAAEVDRRILRPLRLGHTYFPGTRAGLRGPHDRAYVQMADGLPRDFTDYDMSWGWAAGAMVSTPHDVNVFYRALLAGRLLPPAQLAEMTTGTPNGLGLSYAALPCGPAWGHTGTVIGHSTYTFHLADGTRQVTLDENLIQYTAPGIAAARARFIVAALCG
ncbi:serine hydrolase [Actinoplanes sp. L3-i22]|nr:serine hydrolase [Actinoplanes sp. L3-i22]